MTDVTPEHDAAAEAAGKAYAAFNGNPALINEARELLTHRKGIERNNGAAVEATAAQRRGRSDDQPRPRSQTGRGGDEAVVDPQQLRVQVEWENRLPRTTSTTSSRRAPIWPSEKRSGKHRRNPARRLKPNLVKLRDLRNGVAKEMKHPDYFALQVSTYGMTTDEMLKMLDGLDDDAAPALSAASHLDEIQAGREISSAGSRKRSRPIGSTIVGPGMGRPGRGREYRQIVSRDASRSGSSRRRSNFIPGSVSRRCRRQFLDEVGSVSLACAIPSARRTPTPRAGMSISRTISGHCKASNQTRAGFSPRTMSWATATTSRLTPARRCRRSCAPAPRPVSTKASAS